MTTGSETAKGLGHGIPLPCMYALHTRIVIVRVKCLLEKVGDIAMSTIGKGVPVNEILLIRENAEELSGTCYKVCVHHDRIGFRVLCFLWRGGRVRREPGKHPRTANAGFKPEPLRLQVSTLTTSPLLLLLPCDANSGIRETTSKLLLSWKYIE